MGSRTQPRTKRVLIVDDSADSAAIYAAALESIGLTVATSSDCPDAAYFKSRSFDLILLDLKLGSTESLPFIPELKKNSGAKIVVLTAFGCIDAAVEAMKNGASGFLLKSSPITDILKSVAAMLEPDDATHVDGKLLADCGIVGQSPALLKLERLISQVGPARTTVLVTGASGSGKELIARALHRSSLADGPFVPVNCGAIPDQLIESELFGVKKGAFTDAKADRTGMLDAAAGGTLFLDEIGEMPLQVQAKLLRVLQEEEFTPLGDTKRRKLNARIICATNRDLPAMIAEKKFREDLYYRIAVITLRVPTLAERKDDIETLTRFFLDKFNRRFGKNLQMPNEHELAEMTAYDWPGNVRELHNSIERAAVLSTGPRIDLEHVLPVRDFVVHAPDSKHLVGDFKTSLRRFERQYLQSLLEASHGNLSEASRVSGIYRATIYRMARRLNIAIGKDL